MEMTLWVAVTLLVYAGAVWLQKRTGWKLLNPVLVSIFVIIGILRLNGVSYEEYKVGGRWIEYWLQPAIVVLGVPLYVHLREIRRQWIPIFASQIVGCVVGVLSVVLIAKWMGASEEVIISLAPKSVSTAIAVAITDTLGGIPSLTAAIVIFVGLFGAIAGPTILTRGGIKSPMARSLGMGTASHLMGTNSIACYGERYSAYSTIGLILNGILTALLTGPLLQLCGVAC